MIHVAVWVYVFVYVHDAVALLWPGSEAVASEVQRSSEWRMKYLLSNKGEVFVCYLYVCSNDADIHRTTQMTTRIKENNKIFISDLC